MMGPFRTSNQVQTATIDNCTNTSVKVRRVGDIQICIPAVPGILPDNVRVGECTTSDIRGV